MRNPYHVSAVKNLQNCEKGVQIRATLRFMDARSNDLLTKHNKGIKRTVARICTAFLQF